MVGTRFTQPATEVRVSRAAILYGFNDTTTSIATATLDDTRRSEKQIATITKAASDHSTRDKRIKQIDAAIAQADQLRPVRNPLATDANSYNDAKLAYGAEAEKRRKLEENLLHHGIITQGHRYTTVRKEPMVIEKEPAPVKRGRGRPRKDASSVQTLKAPKAKGKVVEFSSKKIDTDSGSGYTKKKSRQEFPSLQKIYYTQLLSHQEEFKLGMKVQFLMKSEEVHEGLQNLFNRPPTLVEWASACGFKEYDPIISNPDFVESPLESSLRPQDSLDSFMDYDDSSQSFFVGNGLAKDNGVGRGKGRVKKPPATKLPDFFNVTLSSRGRNQTKLGSIEPINRGTPSNFVDMMLDAKNAKQRMVECNMRLVLSIARRYTNVGVNVQDLVQEGSIGLMRAVEKFVPSKGFKFSTYASWWIQQAVFRSIAYHSRTIRLPVHVHNFLNRVRRVRTQLQVELGRPPTNDEIAAQMNMSSKKYSKLITLTRRTISLEMPKYQNNPKDLGHESEALLGDTIDSSSAIKDDASPEQSVDHGLFLEDLHDMLKILAEEERAVISLRYGLKDGLTRTVTSVAYQMRQSKAWVRSHECRALRKLRRPWYEKILREHQKSLVGR